MLRFSLGIASNETNAACVTVMSNNGEYIENIIVDERYLIRKDDDTGYLLEPVLDHITNTLEQYGAVCLVLCAPRVAVLLNQDRTCGDVFIDGEHVAEWRRPKQMVSKDLDVKQLITEMFRDVDRWTILNETYRTACTLVACAENLDKLKSIWLTDVDDTDYSIEDENEYDDIPF